MLWYVELPPLPLPHDSDFSMHHTAVPLLVLSLPCARTMSRCFWMKLKGQVSPNLPARYHAPILTSCHHPLRSRTPPYVLPIICYICTCTTDVFGPMAALDTLCPLPILPSPPFAFLSLRALWKLRNVCTHLPQCIYHLSMHQYSSFDRFFMSHQVILILLDNLQRIPYTTDFEAPQSEMRVWMVSVCL